MAACCLKAVLVILNIIFLLIGLVCIALGVVLKVGGTLIQTYAQGALSSLPNIQTGIGLIDSQLSGAQQTVNNTINIGTNSVNQLDLGPFLDSFVAAFIVFGVFITVLAILAFVGGCCGVRVVLIIYAIVVSAIFLTHLILVILLYTGSVDGSIKGQLQGTINNHYEGINGKEAVSLLWNFAMLQYKCCGIDSYKDFDTAAKWQKTRTFNISGVVVSKTLITPVPCCKYSGDFPSVKPVSDECAFLPTDLTSNWKTGCFDKFKTEVITMVNAPSAGFVSAVLVIECAMAVLAIVILLLTRNKLQPV